MALRPQASVLPDLLAPIGAEPIEEEGPDPQDVPSPGVWDTLKAAFRTENIIGSFITDDTLTLDNTVEQGYNPWEDIVGTKYESYWDSFVRSNNPRYSEALKRKIDAEEDDRRTIAAAGGFGIASAMAAGIIDPTILIPVGGQIGAVGKAGASAWRVGRVGRGAARGARAAFIGVGAQETVLQATQEIRTAEETEIALGGSIVLGGLLGGVLGKLTRGERIAAEDALREIQEMSLPGSAGAAAVARLGIDDLTVAGTAAERLADATKAISPNLRSNFREAPSVRQIAQELAENTLYQTMHGEGRSLGAAVETQARVSYTSRMADAVQGHEAIYAEMKKAGFNMSAREFDEAIGRALRRGDVGENEFISRAAKAWRERVFEPFKNEAIDQGLLPADVSVRTAESYLSRFWNTERLTAQEPEFKQKVIDYYSGRLLGDYEESARVLAERKAALEQEVADLRLTPEERARVLDDLEKQGEKLDTANVNEIEQVSRINELRQAAKRAKDSGDVRGEKAAREEIAKIQEQGGKRLADYLKERGKLRGRARKVDLNYAGMAERADRIQASIDNIQQSNIRGVQRLVSRGRTLEKEAQRLDPEKLKQKISDLRTGFYQLIEKSNRAQERLNKSLSEMEPGEAYAKLEKQAAVERARHEQLNAISARLEAAEALDPHLTLAELRASIDDMVKQVSEVALGRGEKVQRLRERLARLDPKKLDERIAAIAETKAKIEREFYDRWEIQRLGEGVGGPKPKFDEQARMIADEVFDKLTGRAATSGSSVDPSYLTAITRGPLKDRTFNIPDELVEDFLHHNIREVGDRYARTMAAEIELTRRFGRADMRDQIGAIRDEYRVLREGVAREELPAPAREAKLKALAADEKGAIRDIEAMRDLVRGTYKAVENASNYGRVVRSLMAFNYIRSMGGAVIANLSELYRPAMVHGLGRYMNQGLGPLLSNLDAVKLSVKEARLSGQVTERILQHRMLTLGEIGDPYRSGTAVERWLSNGARIGSKWNGLVYWTDGMKAISSVLSQNRILEAAVSGKKDTRLLAYLGIDGDMANRVAKQFADHGDDLDGVKVANTERWTDPEAVRAYRAAVSKDVSSIIVTKSVGDVPLFANTPTGKMIMQFRNYTFAAHQRVTLRAMQEDQAQFISGMIGLAALGMLGATLRSWRAGDARFEKFRESASNPGYLVGEGLDLSGMFALPIELGNTVEKLTQPTGFSFNPIKTPLLAAGKLINPEASMQGNSTRFASRDPLSAILGPTAGLPAGVARAAGAPVNIATGEEASQSQANAAASLIPFSSYLGMREALQVLTGDSPYIGE